jgi:tetratricopeptide (TPR) repeat protein
MRSWFTWFVVPFALLLLVSPLRAQENPLDQTARTHFEAGRAYYETGDYENAIREFTRAYELSHRPGLLVNISGCHERLGQLGPAIERLEQFLRESPDVPERATIELRLQRMRERHAAGETGHEERDDEEGPPPPPPAGSSGGSDLVVAGGALLGVAGAGAIVMAIFGGLAMSEDEAVSAECGADAGRSCSDERLSDLFAYSVAADVGLAVAVVAGAVGLVLVIAGATSGGGQRAEVAVVPWVTPDSAGIAAGGTF